MTIKTKYLILLIFLTAEFNNSTTENFSARCKQANLATKGDIAGFIKKTDFHDKLKNVNKNVTPKKSKRVLIENELKYHKIKYKN